MVLIRCGEVGKGDDSSPRIRFCVSRIIVRIIIKVNIGNIIG